MAVQPVKPGHIANVDEPGTEVVEAAELLRPLLRDPDHAEDLARQILLAVSYRGPLPPPAMFADFEKVVPGSAQTILTMAVSEQRHHHAMERRETAYPFIGMALGALSLVFCIAAAVGLAAYDKAPALQGLLVSVPIVGAVGWFVNGRLNRASPNNVRDR